MGHALDGRPLLVRLQKRIEKYTGHLAGPLATDVALHQQSVNEIARLSATVEALSKNVIEMNQEDLNVSVDNLRRHGLSIDGDNAYKRDLLDSAVGAMAFGVQNRNPPPAGHWGQRFWDIGREERGRQEELLVLVQRMRSYMEQAGIDAKPESMNPMEKLASDIDIALSHL